MEGPDQPVVPPDIVIVPEELPEVVPEVTQVVPEKLCVSKGGICEVHSCRMVREVTRVVSQSGRAHAKVSWKCLLKPPLINERAASGSNSNTGAYHILTRKDRVEGQLASQRLFQTSLAVKRSRH